MPAAASTNSVDFEVAGDAATRFGIGRFGPQAHAFNSHTANATVPLKGWLQEGANCLW